MSSPTHFAAAAIPPSSSLVPFTPSILLHLLQRGVHPIPPLSTVPLSTPASPRSALDAATATASALSSSPPRFLSLPSCLLFVDVSGFTAFTESFVSSGLHRLEQLTAHLNASFTSILQCIERYQGDLLKVAGDALMVAFYQLPRTEDGDASGANDSSGSSGSEQRIVDDEVDPLPLLCFRAVSCALELQSNPAFAAGAATMRLHIGVTSGTLHYCQVGGTQQRWVRTTTAATTPTTAAGGSVFSSTPGSPAEPSMDADVITAAEGSGLRSSSSRSPLLPPQSRLAPLVSWPSSVSSVSPHVSSSVLSSEQQRQPPLSLSLHCDRRSASPADVLSSFLPSPVSGAPAGLGGMRWEFLAVGAPFKQLRSAVRDSKAGEVVLTSDTYQRLKQVADVHCFTLNGSTNGTVHTGSANFRLTACALHDSAHPTLQRLVERAIASLHSIRTPSAHHPLLPLPLSSFLMPALLARFSGLSTPSQWLGEYRTVTVMFVSLPNPEECAPRACDPPHDTDTQQPCHTPHSTSASSTPEDPLPSFSSASSSAPSSSTSAPTSSSFSPAPPNWLLDFHSLFVRLQHLLVRCSGQVRQLLVDDKGCVLIAAFGLTPWAHEDDAARACAVGLAMLGAVRRHHSHVADQVSVGVATGRVWCGAVGSDSRKEYAMVGETVNLSARIMGHAATRHRVLCDEATVQACGSRIRFSPVTEVVKVRGKAASVTLYEPLGWARSSVNSTPLRPSSPSGSEIDAVLPAAAPHAFAHLRQPSREAQFAAVQPVDDTTLPLVDHPGSRLSTLQHILSILHPSSPSSPPHSDSTSALSAAPFVILEAGPGQGKTYLACQVCETYRARGLDVLVGRADSVEVNTPFFAVIPLLQELVQRAWDRQQQQGEGVSAMNGIPSPSPSNAAAALSPAQLHSVVSSVLPPSDRPYASLLSSCLLDSNNATSAAADVVAVDGVVEAAMRPTVLRRLMLSLIRHLFTVQPATLLLIEDAHWLDLQSWCVLSEIARAEHTVRLLLATRPLVTTASEVSTPQSTVALYEAVCRCARSHHITLAGVDESSASELAAALLQCRALSPPLAHLIHAKSDGIPLFIQHLVTYLQQKGLIAVHPDTRVAELIVSSAHLLDAVLPSSLEGLLASVLDRLPADCQLALKTASVVGRHFVFSLVLASHPMQVGRDELKAMMEQATRLDVAVEEDGSVEWAALPVKQTLQQNGEVADTSNSDCFYRFTHQLLRDAAYYGLLYHQRREVHARLADYLASNHSHTSASHHTIRSSVHLLAHHYHMALCNADEVLIEQPDQRLLHAATHYLLEAASSSLNFSAVDAGAQLLHRAARCIQLMDTAERTEYWELRWLGALMSTELWMFNVPALLKLAVLWHPSELQDGSVQLAAANSRKLLAQRMLALLESPSAVSDMPPMRVQDYRFSAMLALWMSSWPRKDEALLATRALEAFALSVEGSEAPYYQTETFVSSGSAYFTLNLFSELKRLFAFVEQHSFYHSVLQGRVKLTRYAQGGNPIPHIAMLHAAYRWLQGKVRTCWESCEDVMALIATSAHPPSISRGWLVLLKFSMVAGQCPQSTRVMEAGVLALPAVDSAEAHLPYLMRRCILLSLQVWRHTAAFPPSSLVAPLSPGYGAPYCDELLELIEQLIVDGAVFGVLFHFIHQAFPSVVDFRPEMPLAVHEALVRLMRRYEILFAHNPRVIELARMEAALLVRSLQAGVGDDEEQAEWAMEAERLLTKAMGLVVYEKTPALKVRMTWTELKVWQGRWQEAEVELQQQLDGMPEVEETGSYWIIAAERMLEEVRGNRRENGASNRHGSAPSSSSIVNTPRPRLLAASRTLK